MKRFTAIVHDGEPEEGGFWATCLEVPGANGQGETKDECLQNLAEAIRLLLPSTLNPTTTATARTTSPMPRSGRYASHATAMVTKERNAAVTKANRPIPNPMISPRIGRTSATTRSGLITMPIENAFSRWRESMADDYALEATGKREAFASAFTRLANQNLGEVDPEKWVVFLFYSHPPLGERIAKANLGK